MIAFIVAGRDQRIGLMIPRLFISSALRAGATIDLDEARAHYLRSVLRREPGAPIRLFNAEDGEFDARIAALGKRGGSAVLSQRLRAPEPEPDLHLLFAPVKRAAVEMIIQKGVELGVAAFQPVVTARTQVERLRLDRLEAIAVEAAEQCGRLSAPGVAPPRRLAAILEDWPAGRPLFFCDEAGDDPTAEWGGPRGRAAPLQTTLAETSGADRAAILIGPEGGFAPEERDALRRTPGVVPATLGPRILRADTAAIAAVTLWQAALGDLRAA